MRQKGVDCIPLIYIAAQYLRDHPETREGIARWLILKTWQREFPCSD